LKVTTNLAASGKLDPPVIITCVDIVAAVSYSRLRWVSQKANFWELLKQNFNRPAAIPVTQRTASYHTKATMDPEGARLLTYSSTCLQPAHKYSSLLSTNWLHRVACYRHQAATSLAAAGRHGVSKVLMSGFKSITRNELC